METFTNRLTIELSGHKAFGAEIDIEVDFTISEIIPASGPTYDCAGEPASGGDVEIVAVRPYHMVIEPFSAPPIKREVYLDCPRWLEVALIDCIDQDMLTADE